MTNPVRAADQVAAVAFSLRLVPLAYPTIDDPRSGDRVPGGFPITVTVSTNLPGMGHTVRVLLADGTTELSSAAVTFPGGASPGTADVSLPAAGATDAEYFLEVVPAAGPPHRVVVTVPAADPAMTVAISTTPPANTSTSPPTVPAGEDVAFDANVTNGTGSLSHDWYLIEADMAPVIDPNTTSPKVYNRAASATEFTVRVVARDSSTPPKVAVACFGPFVFG